MAEIKTVTIDELRQMNDQEGLILQGCGGDLQEWVDGINELLVVLLGGMVGIPIDSVAIHPNMWSNTIPQVGVVRDLLFPPDIFEPKDQLVYHAVIVVQQRQTERRIVVRMAQCNKFSPHLTVSV